LFLVLLNGLANSHLFLSLYYLFLFLFAHRLRTAMAYGLAFQNSAPNMRFFASRTCSALQTFGLDFISHAEGNDAGDDGGSEIDLGAQALDNSRGD
jgi:hypothetical protein